MIKDVLESGQSILQWQANCVDAWEFSCIQMFGRFGRAKFRPFSCRQHERRRFG